ncbi:MAG: TatD DNase family protein [Parcubacteria group bacterium Athens0714_16]|nr:MAG: TatD DNase family protein [Parcubacteria group bacterium Athens0714_16]
MEFNYIDIHSHLNFPDFDKDREDVIDKMKSEGIGTICVGADLKTSRECVELADKYENIWATIGVHPNDSEEDFREEDYLELVKNKRVVGVGECGLDYFRTKGEPIIEKKRQRDLFEKQIQFAIKNNLPLMIHARDSYDDILDILISYKKEFGDKVCGNIHFFAGSKDTAKKFIEIGFTISFSGVITFTNDYDEAVKYVPIDKIMPDSDSPFVAPAPFRGKRNEPFYIKEIVKRIAEIKELDLETVKEQMVKNAIKLFKLPITNL